MTRVPVAVTETALGLCLVLVGTVPGAAQYVTWSGSDPALTGCASGPMIVRPDRFTTPLNRSAAVSLRYSWGCRTVWAELVGGVPGSTSAWVERPDGRRLDCTADANGACSTAQLDDAGVMSCAGAREGAATVRTTCY